MARRHDTNRKTDPDKSGTLRHKTDEPREVVIAKLAAGGILEIAATAQNFTRETLGEAEITATFEALVERGEAVNRGDLREVEKMLVAQASALNSIFAAMGRRAALNMGEHLGAMETYLRLALKAQTQCRATLETLATIKAGPTVIARQANIAHGPQQVNNGAAAQGSGNFGTPSRARARDAETERNELLGASNGERLDTGTAGTASGSDPTMEAVESIDRPAH